MQNKTFGMVYVATGEPYVEEALESIKQVKSINKNINVVLFSDYLPGTDYIDHEIRIENPLFSVKDKMMCLEKTPFYYNIFVDSDTYFLEDPSKLRGIFDRFDFACAHAPIRVSYENNDVPFWFPEVNGGLLCYSLSEKTKSFFSIWKRLYERDEIRYANDQNKWPQALRGLREQPTLREALYKSDLSVYILPPEFNYRTILPGFAGSKIYMLHGRMKNLTKFSKLVNKVNTPRIISTMESKGGYYVLTKNSFFNKFVLRLSALFH